MIDSDTLKTVRALKTNGRSNAPSLLSNLTRFDRIPNSSKPFGTDAELLPGNQTPKDIDFWMVSRK